MEFKTLLKNRLESYPNEKIIELVNNYNELNFQKEFNVYSMDELDTYCDDNSIKATELLEKISPAFNTADKYFMSLNGEIGAGDLVSFNDYKKINPDVCEFLAGELCESYDMDGMLDVAIGQWL